MGKSEDKVDNKTNTVIEVTEKSDDRSQELSNVGKILTSLAAGGIAGGIAKTVIAPLDRSKIFFQTNETRNYRFRYAIRWLKHGYRTEGLLSLWRGNTATLARIVPYSAINFMSFEQYKKLLKVEETGTPGYHRFIAGLLGQTASYPLDIVRRRMQTGKQLGKGNKYITVVGTLLTVYRSEGIYRGWYKGLSMNLIKGPIAVSIAYTVNDYVRIVLNLVFGSTDR